MWIVPIVEEIRSHREAHAEQFDYDFAAICRDLRRQQESSGRKIVSLPAKRVRCVEDVGERSEAGKPSD